MPKYSARSLERLSTCITPLVDTGHAVISIYDHSVIEGARSRQRQEELYEAGATTLHYPGSKHNIVPPHTASRAVDIWPYIPPFGALSGHPDQVRQIAQMRGVSVDTAREFVFKAFAFLAGTWIGTGAALGYKFRWGGDWDGDGNLLDQSFHDLPHIEYVGPL